MCVYVWQHHEWGFLQWIHERCSCRVKARTGQRLIIGSSGIVLRAHFGWDHVGRGLLLLLLLRRRRRGRGRRGRLHLHVGGVVLPHGGGGEWLLVAYVGGGVQRGLP